MNAPSLNETSRRALVQSVVVSVTICHELNPFASPSNKKSVVTEALAADPLSASTMHVTRHFFISHSPSKDCTSFTHHPWWAIQARLLSRPPKKSDVLAFTEQLLSGPFPTGWRVLQHQVICSVCTGQCVVNNKVYNCILFFQEPPALRFSDVYK